MSNRQSDHIRFLNSYYAKTRGVYDATRKYYLLGRDALLNEIIALRPGSVIEVGCGTGRNLAVLQRQLPHARFGGVEPCASMRDTATRRYPWITMSEDLAENANLPGVLSQAPDVVFFSYALSMVQEKEEAIENCLRALAPGGRLYVLDFGDLRGLGRTGRSLFGAWLHAFHVFPEQLDSIWGSADEVTQGAFSYWKRGLFRAGTDAKAVVPCPGRT